MEKQNDKVLDAREYKELKEGIEELLDGSLEGGKEGQAAKVRAYWEIGGRIEKAGLMKGGHYGESVINELAKDLGIYPRTLRACVEFRRRYIWYRSVPNLSWSCLRELISIKDDKKRAYYEQKMLREDWGRDRLLLAEDGEQYEREVLKKEPVKKGLPRPQWAGHIYKARLEKAVDADTVDFWVDLGFKVWVDQTVRLAKLDAAARETTGGKAAYEAVRDRLVKAGTIVLKTEKDDIYGRMVGHVFYTAEERKSINDVFENGRYLNGELVAEGLAKRV